MNLLKTLKEPVFAFWFILATWDFVATSISVFLLHGGEVNSFRGILSRIMGSLDILYQALLIFI